MTVLQLIFIATGVVTILAAVMVVSSPNLVHAGLWLILTLAGVAVTFVLLEAGFLAVVQVAVYIDAIAILIIVTVMLTRRAMGGEYRSQVSRTWLWAALAAFIFLGALLFLLNQMPGIEAQAASLPETAEGYLEDLGKSLVDVDRYVIPFEVASILLLAAMIGAIVVARPPAGQSGEGGEG
jgi:NADH-quinone oxidoreductase subunit J